MRKFKKLVSGIVTMAMATSVAAIMPVFSASATTDSVLLGDANDDGAVTGRDALSIEAYLQGTVRVSSRQLTAMDTNCDGIIDNTDATYIKKMISTGNTNSFHTIEKELYSVTDNSTRAYRKHYCSSSNSNSYTTYSLSETFASLQSLQDEPVAYVLPSQDFGDTVDKLHTKCVELTITKYNGDIIMGSGFIIDDNIVATAANRIYDSNGFVKSVTATIYEFFDEDGYELATPNVYKATSHSLHIPDNYATSGSSIYDYGLIRFYNFKNISTNEILDTSDYKVDLGIMTDYFLYPAATDTSHRLATVGFTNHTGNGWNRYMSVGSVVSMYNTYPNERYYRFHSTAQVFDGKKGGMTYTETYNDYVANNLVHEISTNSVVGIATDDNSLPGNNTFGVRMTPTLLRFYLNNTNI